MRIALVALAVVASSTSIAAADPSTLLDLGRRGDEPRFVAPPGRYQEEAISQCKKQRCVVKFPRLPTGKTLEIGAVSCTVIGNKHAKNVFMAIPFGGDSPAIVKMTSVLTGDTTTFIASTNLAFFTDNPRLEIMALFGGTLSGAFCAMSGTLL
jgi:hypothetical protein